MKKTYLSLLLMAFFGLSLLTTSCGGGGNDDPNLVDLLDGTWSGLPTEDLNSFFSEDLSVTFTKTGDNTGNISLTIEGTTQTGTYTVNGSDITTTIEYNNSTVILASASVSDNTLNFTVTLINSKGQSTTFTFSIPKA